MRKTGWVLLGLVVFIAALGFATNRHYLEPQKARVVTSSSQQAPAAPSSSAAKRPAPVTTTTTAGWQSFDTVINVLNVVVGIVGIWMTFHGMRMQRMALNAQSPNLQSQNRR